MSYTYSRTIARTKERRSRWKEVNIAEWSLRDIYDVFVDGRIEVTHPALTEPHYFQLGDVLHLISDLDQTLNEWLVSLGNATLPTTVGSPTLLNKVVDYRDAWMADFSIKQTKMGSHPDNDWSIDQKTDLLLTKDKVDYKELYEHCLVTVNGLIHQTSHSDAGLYVVNGTYSQLKSNETMVGLIDFSALGKLTFIDLNSDMIYRPHSDGKLYQYAHVNLGQSFEGKIPLLVIGGYLHILDNYYKEIGDGLLQIDFNRYPMVQRYYDSRNIVNLETLPLSLFERNPNQRLVDELVHSEETINAILNLSNTFVVLVDAPHIYVEKHSLEYSGFPGTFIADRKPTWPLKTANGQLKEYWTYFDDERWVVNCVSNLIPNYQFHHTHYLENQSVTDQKVPSKPFIADRGFLLEIGRDI